MAKTVKEYIAEAKEKMLKNGKTIQIFDLNNANSQPQGGKMSHDNWLENLWEARCIKWSKNSSGKIISKYDKLRDVVGSPPAALKSDAADDFRYFASHLRSGEEFVTQILAFLLNSEQCKRFQQEFYRLIEFEPNEEYAPWKAEYSSFGKKQRLDMVLRKKEQIAAIIENKIEADFSDGQISSYASQIVPGGKMVAITKYYCDTNRLKKEAGNGISATSLYWHEIYSLLNTLPDKIGTETKAVFELFGLHLKVFATNIDHRGQRAELVKKFKSAANASADDFFAIAGRRLKDSESGFFHFLVYPKNIRPDCRKYKAALPCCSIEVDGFLTQGGYTNCKTSSQKILHVHLEFFDCNGKKTASKEFDGQLTDIDERSMNKYLTEVSHFLQHEITSWKENFEKQLKQSHEDIKRPL